MVPRFLLITGVFLLTACSHPLEIVGEGDIIDLQGSRSCTYEQFSTPTADGSHPCPNYVVGEYLVDYVPIPKPGWQFTGWQNYCQKSNYGCHLQVAASLVEASWGTTVPPLVAHFEPLEEPEEISAQRLDIDATAVIFRNKNTSYLLTTSSESATYPAALLRLDAETSNIKTLMALEYRAHSLELSADEKTLYIAYSDMNRVDMFDLATNQLIKSIKLGKTNDGTQKVFASSISASPTDASVVVVTGGRGDYPYFLQDHYKVSMYRNGTLVGPSIVSGMAPYRVEFSLDGRWLHGAEVNILVSTNGLGQPVRNINSRFAHLRIIDGKAFSRQEALDPKTFLPIGVYRPRDYYYEEDAPAYAPAVERVFFYDSDHKLLLVNHATRYTALATYSLPIDGEYRGKVASNTNLLVFTDSALYLVDHDRVEPMYKDSCSTGNMVAEIGKPYLRIACRLQEIEYDRFRNKVYASVNGSLGENGNSIAVIDSHSGLVEAFIPTASEPQHLALNADGTKLFVNSSVSGFVHRIDLASNTMDPGYWPGTGILSLPIVDLLAHPTDPTAFVVVRSGGEFGRKDMLSASDLVTTGQFNISPSYLHPHWSFSPDGNLVVSHYSSGYLELAIQEFDFSAAGFSVVQEGSPAEGLVPYVTTVTASDTSLIFGTGAKLNRATLALEASLQFPSPYDLENTLVIALDTDGESLYHGAGRQIQDRYLRLDRYDMTSGNATGKLEFDGLDSDISEYDLRSMISTADDKLVLHANVEIQYMESDSYIYLLQESDFSQ